MNWLMTNLSGGNFIARYLTAVQYYDAIQVAVLSSALILAFWVSSRVLHVNVSRGITVPSLAVGVLLTALSLADSTVGHLLRAVRSRAVLQQRQ